MRDMCISFERLPTGDTSIDRSASFVQMVQSTIGGERLRAGKKHVDDLSAYLASLVAREERSQYAHLGTVVCATVSNDEADGPGSWAVSLSFGARPSPTLTINDMYLLHFGDDARAWLPFKTARECVARGVSILDPFVAAIRSVENEMRLESLLCSEGRQTPSPWPDGFIPGSITYVGRDLVGVLGKERIIACPAVEVESVGSGYLITAIDNYLDESRERDRAAQIAVLRHFDFLPREQ